MSGCQGSLEARRFSCFLSDSPQKPVGAEEGGKQTLTFGLFLPALSFCLSIAFETDDERESNYRAAKPDCRCGEWKSIVSRPPNLELVTEALAITFIKLHTGRKKPDSAFQLQHCGVSTAEHICWFLSKHAHSLVAASCSVQKQLNKMGKSPQQVVKSQWVQILEHRGLRKFYWR